MFEHYSLNELTTLKDECDHLYYNTGETSKLTDWEYDLLKDEMMSRGVSNANRVGIMVKTNVKRVELPCWMGSLNKVSIQGPEDIVTKNRQIDMWKNGNISNQYNISDKLDGVSCLYTYDKENGIKLYTRGNGTVGTDISHLADYIQSIPRPDKPITVRGELIIPVKCFESKYKQSYANARNMVSGMVTSKELPDGVSDVHFVVYNHIGSKQQTQTRLLKELDRIGFEIVPNIVESFENIHSEECVRILEKRRRESVYEIDGIVIQPEQVVKTNTKGNPSWCLAFKYRSSDNLYETVVEHVEWRVSKRGYMKPRIKLRPVQMSGVTVTYVTGFNAKYVKDHSIGKGTVLRLTRSGDVIPHIVSVVKPSQADLPSDKSYVWTESGVDIVCQEKDITQTVKKLHAFFKHVGAKHIAEKSIVGMVESGYDTVPKILDMTLEQYKDLPGYGEKRATIAYNSIQTSCRSIPIDLFLSASGLLGDGIQSKKVNMLLEAFPDLLNSPPTIEQICEVRGFNLRTATVIVKNIPFAKERVNELCDRIRQRVTCSTTSSEYYFVFSGFRDAELETYIQEHGATVDKSMTKRTTHLVVKHENYTGTAKTRRAIEKGVTIVTRANIKLILEN